MGWQRLARVLVLVAAPGALLPPGAGFAAARGKKWEAQSWERLGVPQSLTVQGVKQHFCGGGERRTLAVAFFADKAAVLRDLRSRRLDEGGRWQAVRDAKGPKTLVLRLRSNADVFELVGELDKALRACPPKGVKKGQPTKGTHDLRRVLLGGLQEEKGSFALQNTKIAIASPADDGPCKVSVSGKVKGQVSEKAFMQRCVNAFAGPANRGSEDTYFGVELEMETFLDEKMVQS